jgi:hypothetical protein
MEEPPLEELKKWRKLSLVWNIVWRRYIDVQEETLHLGLEFELHPSIFEVLSNILKTSLETLCGENCFRIFQKKYYTDFVNMFRCDTSIEVDDYFHSDNYMRSRFHVYDELIEIIRTLLKFNTSNIDENTLQQLLSIQDTINILRDQDLESFKTFLTEREMKFQHKLTKTYFKSSLK